MALSEQKFYIKYKVRKVMNLGKEVVYKTMDMRRYRHFYLEFERYIKSKECQKKQY